MYGTYVLYNTLSLWFATAVGSECLVEWKIFMADAPQESDMGTLGCPLRGTPWVGGSELGDAPSYNDFNQQMFEDFGYLIFREKHFSKRIQCTIV